MSTPVSDNVDINLHAPVSTSVDNRDDGMHTPDSTVDSKSYAPVSTSVDSNGSKTATLQPEPVIPAVIPVVTAQTERVAPVRKELKPSPVRPVTAATRLNQNQLATRFGHVNGSQVFKHKDKGNFLGWSRGKDPVGIAWGYDGDKYFYPIFD